MQTFQFVLIAIYTGSLIYITAFAIIQLRLLQAYRKYKTQKAVFPALGEGDHYPVVTIQLPIFNEVYVVDRLIDNICRMDYPREKLEIQVLDDSTDETVECAARKVAHYREQGIDIVHLHRTDRKGYKAGALREGTAVCRGEFIAIFDADFLPNPDFLKKALPHFSSPQTGVVQTRWEHINEDYSLLTKLQAFQLNVHFTVEQAGRFASGHFLQFNGTAGIWRKTCIEDAGGWQSDTLTEDLDLSYRAQLRGWKIHYVEDIVCPAELPAEIHGLKSQQFRWMKGGAENSRKLLPIILRAKLPLDTKFHAVMHLLGSSIFLVIFGVALLSVPVLWAMEDLQLKATFLGFCLLGTLAVMSVFYEANNMMCWKRKHVPYRFLRFFLLFPLFMALSMGFSLHNSAAVIDGYLGRKSTFVRTPKFNLTGLRQEFLSNAYRIRNISTRNLLELMVCLYFAVAIAFGIYVEYYSFLLFHILLMTGFGLNLFYSVRHLSIK
ncbi:MAG: glycosyltransferase family 2 protein [Saprospiraceae bacterium]|nr:glycosyltransferase family 2 protein [Saprospiraceae bacterium]